MRQPRRWLVLPAAAVPLAALGYDQAACIWWVGDTDLEVEFRVVDAATGELVEGAEVAIRSAGGFSTGNMPFALSPDLAAG